MYRYWKLPFYMTFAVLMMATNSAYSGLFDELNRIVPQITKEIEKVIEKPSDRSRDRSRRESNEYNRGYEDSQSGHSKVEHVIDNGNGITNVLAKLGKQKGNTLSRPEIACQAISTLS